jgi:hypothetical protein
MEITVYERTWDQNEELGINDMNVWFIYLPKKDWKSVIMLRWIFNN